MPSESKNPSPPPLRPLAGDVVVAAQRGEPGGGGRRPQRRRPRRQGLRRRRRAPRRAGRRGHPARPHGELAPLHFVSAPSGRPLRPAQILMRGRSGARIKHGHIPFEG